MDFLQVFGWTNLGREQSRKATLSPNTIYDDRTTEWKLNNNKPINNWNNELTQIFKPNSWNEYIQTITIGKHGIDSLALATKKCCSCFKKKKNWFRLLTSLYIALFSFVNVVFPVSL